MFTDRFAEQNQAAAATMPQPSPNGKNGSTAPKPKAAGTAPPPSPNGDNGNPEAPGQPGERWARDSQGRFIKGNFGGPGNPFGRQVALLRQAALDTISAADIRAIMAKLRELALEGDVGAAKVLLGYVLGKPVPVPNPDRMDVEEFDYLKETAPMMRESVELKCPDPCVPLSVARALRDAKTLDQGGMLATLFSMPTDERDNIAKLAGQGDLKALKILRAKMRDPSTISVVGNTPPPSTNGKNGTRPPSTNGKKKVSHG